MFSRHVIEIFVMLGGAFVLGYLWRGVSNVAPVAMKTTRADDDFMDVSGMTDESEVLLHDAAIYTFKQLAATRAERLKEILSDGGVKNVDSTGWPKEAARLRDGK